MKLTKIAMFMVPALLSANVLAADEEKSWHASAELGAIFTSGNTETTSIKGKLDIQQEFDAWKTQYIADAFFKEDEVTNDVGEKETVKTAEKYSLSAQGDYKLATEGSSLFVLGSYFDDEFGAIVKETTIAAGYGTQLLKTEDKLLTVNIGPGYIWGEQADGTGIDSAIARASGKFDWTINENVAFSQSLIIEPSFEGDKNIKAKAESGLTTKFNSSFQMKLGLTVTHNTEVPVATENTDVETTVTLVYTF
jgi:putative salt-induced outer membrane protein YdiY